MSCQSWRFEKILPLGCSRTTRGHPGFESRTPQSLMGRNFVVLWPKATHSTYLNWTQKFNGLVWLLKGIFSRSIFWTPKISLSSLVVTKEVNILHCGSHRFFTCLLNPTSTYLYSTHDWNWAFLVCILVELYDIWRLW